MSEEKQFYVYVHRKATDGSVFYVGKGIGRRYSSRSDRNIYWNRVVNKYGFTSHIVMTFKKEACSFSLERALIKFYGRDKLCNMTDGGEGQSGASQETRNKISKSNMGKVQPKEAIKRTSLFNTGKPLSNDTKRKISLAKTGVKKSKETKEKMSASRIGKNLSEETKIKMSISKKGIPRPQWVKDKISNSKNKLNKDINQLCFFTT